MTELDITPHERVELRSGSFEADILLLRPALHAFAHRFCQNKQEIDDLVQDTLLKALRFRDRFQSGTALKS
jgi:RNA polymerase sigma-70 factor (ECF subfamily)